MPTASRIQIYSFEGNRKTEKGQVKNESGQGGQQNIWKAGDVESGAFCFGGGRKGGKVSQLTRKRNIDRNKEVYERCVPVWVVEKKKKK